MRTRRQSFELRGQGGFTLIEILLALAILSIMTSIMWGSFARTARSKRTAEAAQDRVHTVRVALMRIAREIEMAFLSDSENSLIAERPTLFVASAQSGVATINFSAFAHQRLRAGAAEGDTSVLSFYGEPDPDDRRVTNLMRRETRRLQALDPMKIPGEAYIICPNIASFRLSFYDRKKKEWREDWNTIGATGMQYLPTHVRITVTVYDQRGREQTYSTDARIHMTERVGYKPIRT